MTATPATAVVARVAEAEAAGATTAEFWLGRTVPSRHNLSAPDIRFGNFRNDRNTRRPGE